MGLKTANHLFGIPRLHASHQRVFAKYLISPTMVPPHLPQQPAIMLKEFFFDRSIGWMVTVGAFCVPGNLVSPRGR